MPYCLHTVWLYLGAVVYWLRVRTPNTGVMSSNPTRVAINTS